MSDERRAVRATASFFEDLDAQLRPERGPHGEPSVHDFQVFELLRFSVVGQLAADGAVELVELDIDLDPGWS